MTSKAQKKAENWTPINPPIPAEIQHQRSGERRTLDINARHRGRVEAIWPGTGRVVFDLSTGYGASDCRDWRLTLESARALSGKPDLELREPERTERGRPKVYGKPRAGGDQLSLLDRVSAQPVTPEPPAHQSASTGLQPSPPKPGPMRLAFGPHDYEGQGRERYHDTPEGQRAGLVAEMTANLNHGTPEPDRAFARGWLDEHRRTMRAVQKQAHAYLLREGAACEVRP